MLMEKFDEHKKKIIIISICLFVALIGLAIYKALQNPYGNQLEISNLSNYTDGKVSNTDRINFIQNALYKTVSFNTKEVKNNGVKDILVRDGSFEQKFDSEKKVYTVRFIVDIASLKQSYLVSYEWQEDGSGNSKLNEYGTQVACLPLKSLKYPDFKCVDERIVEYGVDKFDPVGLVLPRHVYSKYKITGFEKSVSTVRLDVEAYAPRTVARIDNTVLDPYTNDINTWLRSEKLDPKRYTINYIY